MNKLKIVFISFLMVSFLSAQNIDKYGIVLSGTNLEFVMNDIFKSFYKKYPNDHIWVQYESSGKIRDSILNGKQYDLFLSTNKKFAETIYKAHKAVTKPKYFTKGAVILFSKNSDFRRDSLIKILENNTILLGNAKNTVFGYAGLEVLKNLKIYNKVKKNIIYDKNIALVVDDIIWANNKIAIIPKSALNIIPIEYSVENKNWILIDSKLYSPIKEYFVISKRGIKKQAIIDFTNFLLSKEGQKILIKDGYLPMK